MHTIPVRDNGKEKENISNEKWNYVKNGMARNQQINNNIAYKRSAKANDDEK